jgi:hypothetical protein
MPLPAPYASPWKRLGEDGVAILAWLGLKGRELWRRNREGTLPVPPFWPRRYPRLFWPLALAAALAVALTVTLLAVRVQMEPSPARPPVSRFPNSSPASSGEPAETAETAETEAPSTETSDSPGTEAVSATPPSPPQAPADEPPPSPAAELLETPADEPPPTPEAEGAPSPEEQEAKRLWAAWNANDSPPLIAAFRPEPANATLTLELADTFAALAASERQRQAERWRQRAMDEGYIHLRLRDGRGRLLGREALVGEGMIVLDQPGAAGEDS